MTSTREQVLELLEQGLSYSETARRLGLTYGQVYSRAASSGIADERRARAAAAAAEKERRRAEDARADRARLAELLAAHERGELLRLPPTTYGELGAIVAWYLCAPCGRVDDVVWSREETAPLNRSERSALEKLEALEVAARDRTPLAPTGDGNPRVARPAV